MILNGLNNLEINIKGINYFLVNDHKKHNDIIYYLEQYFDHYKYQLKDYSKYNVNEILILDNLDIISRNRYNQCVFIDSHKDIDKYLKNNKGDILHENSEHKFSNINLSKYEEQINNIYCEIVNEYKQMYKNFIFEINEKSFNHELFLKNIIVFEIYDHSNINKIISIVKMVVENSQNSGLKSFICLTNIEKYLDKDEYQILSKYLIENEVELYVDMIISYCNGEYISFNRPSYIINKDQVISMYKLDKISKIVEDNISNIALINDEIISTIIKENIYQIINDKCISKLDLEIINIIRNGKQINIENNILTISEI